MTSQFSHFELFYVNLLRWKKSSSNWIEIVENPEPITSIPKWVSALEMISFYFSGSYVSHVFLYLVIGAVAGYLRADGSEMQGLWYFIWRWLVVFVITCTLSHLFNVIACHNSSPQSCVGCSDLSEKTSWYCFILFGGSSLFFYLLEYFMVTSTGSTYYSIHALLVLYIWSIIFCTINSLSDYNKYVKQCGDPSSALYGILILLSIQFVILVI